MICRAFAVVLLAMVLGACTAMEAGTEVESAGSATPAAAVAAFFTDLNTALQDPAIQEPDGRRAWSERLAHHFAPTERDDQRLALGLMLRSFGESLNDLDANETLSIIITYTDVEVVEQRDNQAQVYLEDAYIRLEHYYVTEENVEIVLQNQQRSLADVLGMEREVFPVLQVNERWFLTEY